ncbi:MAG: hypothetical protein HPZ74_07685 [Christensenellaceae bacterium]|nr:hypothetical protein [Christensenellaceae bacterium]
MAQKGSTNSQQFAWQRSAAMLRFIRISQNAKSHCASCRIFIWKECIIRLRPTAEGMEISMGGRQKCGNPKKKIEFLMRPIPPVIHPACNIPLQYTIAYVVFL